MQLSADRFAKHYFRPSLSGMTDATYIPRFALWGGRDRAQDSARPAPAPQPVAPPVFIHDCVTPLGGETVLSLLLKRSLKEDDQE